MKAGYVEYDKKKSKFVSPDMGVPQGGIISPLLSNVMLHELDLYIEELRQNFIKQSDGHPLSIANPVYRSLSHLIEKIRKYNLPSELRQTVSLRNRVKSSLPNPLSTKIEYVRYADDWLLGVWGTKATAKSLKSNIASFLASLKLQLSEEKTLITNTRRGKVKFLGTLINRVSPTRGRLAIPKLAGRIRMNVPLQSLTERLHEKGF